MDMQKLAAIAENEALKAELEKIESAEEAYEVLKKEDPSLTEEEFRSLIHAQKGELSEDDLDSVSGGVWRKPDIIIKVDKRFPYIHIIVR